MKTPESPVPDLATLPEPDPSMEPVPPAAPGTAATAKPVPAPVPETQPEADPDGPPDPETARQAVLKAKLAQVGTLPGLQVEFDPEEADQAGLFREDALSLEDAEDASFDPEIAP